MFAWLLPIVLQAVLPVALATPADDLLSRLDEIAHLRAQRSADGAPVITRDEYLRIAAGEAVTGLVAVEGHAAKKAWGATILSQPIAVLWAAINDETHHVGYTQMGYSELLSGRACESGRRVLQYLPVGVPFVSDRWWVTIIDENTALTSKSGGAVRELGWRSSVDPAEITSEEGKRRVASGVPVRFTKGGWFLVSLDPGRTLLEYYLWTDPGGSLPAGATGSFAASGIRNAFDAMDRYAREGVTRCPVR